MKTLIAVPCMDYVAAGFAQSLAMLRKKEECKIAMTTSSLIYESRNRLAEQAVKMEADRILWLDSDMVFCPDILERLSEDLDSGMDMVTGLYFRRTSPYTPVIFSKLDIEEGRPMFEDYNDFPKDTFEVEGCGFGAVLMSTDIIFDVLGKYGTCFSPVAGFGEDLSFCWRARECGYHIMCDPGVKLGHTGHVTVTEDFYKAFRNRG